MLSSGSIWRTGIFPWCYWEYTTELKIHFLFHIGNGIIKRTGFANNCNTEVKRKYTAKCLALEVNKRLTILHDFNGSILQNWSSISCLTFGKWRKQLVLLISNWRGNILYNVQLWMYMSDWHFCMILMGLQYQVEILFPVSHLKKKNIGETIWNSIFCCSFEQCTMFTSWSIWKTDNLAWLYWKYST